MKLYRKEELTDAQRDKLGLNDGDDSFVALSPAELSDLLKEQEKRALKVLREFEDYLNKHKDLPDDIDPTGVMYAAYNAWLLLCRKEGVEL